MKRGEYYSFIPATISNGMFSSERVVKLPAQGGTHCALVDKSQIEHGMLKVLVLERDIDWALVFISSCLADEQKSVVISSNCLDIADVMFS